MSIKDFLLKLIGKENKELKPINLFSDIKSKEKQKKLIRKNCPHCFVLRHTTTMICAICGLNNTEIIIKELKQNNFPYWWCYIIKGMDGEKLIMEDDFKVYQNIVLSKMVLTSVSILNRWISMGQLKPRDSYKERYEEESAIPFISFCHEQSVKGGQGQK